MYRYTPANFENFTANKGYSHKTTFPQNLLSCSVPLYMSHVQVCHHFLLSLVDHPMSTRGQGIPGIWPIPLPSPQGTGVSCFLHPSNHWSPGNWWERSQRFPKCPPHTPSLPVSVQSPITQCAHVLHTYHNHTHYNFHFFLLGRLRSQDNSINTRSSPTALPVATRGDYVDK